MEVWSSTIPRISEHKSSKGLRQPAISSLTRLHLALVRISRRSVGPHEAVSSCSELSTCQVTHLNHSSTGAFIMSLTYGFEVKSHEDPFIAAAERGLVIIEEATIPGAFLVDTFPICTHQRESALHIPSVIILNVIIVKHMPSWFPGARFKHFAQAARKDLGIAVDGPLDFVRKSLKVRLRGYSDGLYRLLPVRKREERLDSIHLLGSH